MFYSLGSGDFLQLLIFVEGTVLSVRTLLFQELNNLSNCHWKEEQKMFCSSARKLWGVTVVNISVIPEADAGVHCFCNKDSEMV